MRAGVLAGTLGGALMAVVVFRLTLAGTPESWQPLRAMAAALLGEDALAGGAFAMLVALAIHVVTSSAWGIAFAWLAGTRPRGVASVGLGVAASLVIMVIMTFGVLPTVDPILYEQAMLGLPSWIVAHVTYGFGLAIAPAIRRSTARSDEATTRALPAAVQAP